MLNLLNRLKATQTTREQDARSLEIQEKRFLEKVREAALAKARGEDFNEDIIAEFCERSRRPVEQLETLDAHAEAHLQTLELRDRVSTLEAERARVSERAKHCRDCVHEHNQLAIHSELAARPDADLITARKRALRDMNANRTLETVRAWRSTCRAVEDVFDEIESLKLRDEALFGELHRISNRLASIGVTDDPRTQELTLPPNN